MKDAVDLTTLRELLEGSLADLTTRIAELLPSLINATLLVLFGWLLAFLVDRLGTRALRKIGVDRAAARLQFVPALERAGVGGSAARLVGRLSFWLILLTFLLSAIRALDLPVATAALDRLIAYLPHVAGAVLIFLAGMLAARFTGNLVASAAGAAGYLTARRIGFAAHGSVVVLVVVVTLEQLGVPTAVLLGPLTVVLAAGVLSAGLAFALGARPVITHILAGHFLKQSLPRQTSVEVRGKRGVVERVGPTDTLLRNGDESWSVPNAQLLEDVVIR